MVDTIEDLSEEITGREILSAEVTDDGLHINLSDGNILIIVGVFNVGLLKNKVSFQ